MAIAITMSVDISAQARFIAACASVMMVTSCTWLLCFIREKDQGQKANDGGISKIPFLATMYALRRNQPYLNCEQASALKRLPGQLPPCS